MKKMSPEAARLYTKILKIGPRYFDAVVPLHERQVELCEAIQRAKTTAEIRRLNAELRAVSEEIDGLFETRQ